MLMAFQCIISHCKNEVPLDDMTCDSCWEAIRRETFVPNANHVCKCQKKEPHRTEADDYPGAVEDGGECDCGCRLI